MFVHWPNEAVSDRNTRHSPLDHRDVLLGKNVVSYVAPEVSFSMRDRRDQIEIQVQSNDEFRSCQMPIKTTSKNGIITSFYSNDDQRGLVLGLKDGKLQLNYHLPSNRTGHLLFLDNQTINDGQAHRIFVNAAKHDQIHLEIDKRSIDVPRPDDQPLFFDVVTIGGPYRLMSSTSNPFVGCFANVTYNRHPLLPEGVLKADRYDCFYQQGMICDRQIPCQISEIRPTQFCGQNDCSMVCAPNTYEMSSRGLVRYSTQMAPGQREQLDLTIFTTSANSTLYVARDGPVQVSIVLQVLQTIETVARFSRSFSSLELLPSICLSEWSDGFDLRLSWTCPRRSMAYVAVSEDAEHGNSTFVLLNPSVSFFF